MKILLTGEPHVGKSTLINKIIAAFPERQGFVTNEVATNTERTGFELVSAGGARTLLASIHSKSHHRVSRYGVEVEEFESFLEKLPDPRPKALLYIDEIGQMELFSEKFKETTRIYLDSPNSFIGTLTSVYEDDFTREIRKRLDVSIVEVTSSNRDSLQEKIIHDLRR